MKMTKKYDNLDDAFNVESTVVPESKDQKTDIVKPQSKDCLLYTSPSPRDQRGSRMPSSA